MPASVVAGFSVGPTLTQVAATTSGRRYYITAGTRREVLDDLSLTQAGVPSTAAITVSDSGLSTLSLATPVVRDDVTIQNRADSTTDLYSSGMLYPISSGLYASTPVTTVAPIAGQLDPASLALLTLQPPVSGYATDGLGQSWVVTATGKTAISAASELGVPFTAWPTGILTSTPTLAPATVPILIKQANVATTFAVDNGVKYPVSSWADAQLITQDSRPSVVTVLSQEFDAIPTGSHPTLVPATLVKTATDPSVYLVDGLNGKLHISSMWVAGQLGLRTISVVASSILDAYQTESGDQSPAISCDGSNDLVVGGVLRTVPAAEQANYGLTYTPLDDVTCRNLDLSTGADLTGPVFVRTSSSRTVYELSGGQRHPVANWAALLNLNHGAVPTIVIFAPGQLDGIPLGS
jgi:hypothetical protein